MNIIRCQIYASFLLNEIQGKTPSSIGIHTTPCALKWTNQRAKQEPSSDVSTTNMTKMKAKKRNAVQVVLFKCDFLFIVGNSFFHFLNKIIWKLLSVFCAVTNICKTFIQTGLSRQSYACKIHQKPLKRHKLYILFFFLISKVYVHKNKQYKGDLESLFHLERNKIWSIFTINIESSFIHYLLASKYILIPLISCIL